MSGETFPNLRRSSGPGVIGSGRPTWACPPGPGAGCPACGVRRSRKWRVCRPTTTPSWSGDAAPSLRPGMTAALRRRSAEFAALWDTHDVGLRRNDHKRIVHPMLGVIELDCHSLFSENGRQRLLWFTAPPTNGTAGSTRLAHQASIAPGRPGRDSCRAGAAGE